MQWDECKSFLRVDELLETRTMNTEKLRELLTDMRDAAQTA